MRHARPARRLRKFRLRCSMRQRLADVRVGSQAVHYRLQVARPVRDSLQCCQRRGRLGTGAGRGCGVIQRVAGGAARGNVIAGTALRKVLVPAQKSDEWFGL